jgi:hypothetical protein
MKKHTISLRNDLTDASKVREMIYELDRAHDLVRLVRDGGGVGYGAGLSEAIDSITAAREVLVTRLGAISLGDFAASPAMRSKRSAQLRSEHTLRSVS